jgi:hypothetical protein
MERYCIALPKPTRKLIPSLGIQQLNTMVYTIGKHPQNYTIDLQYL